MTINFDKHFLVPADSPDQVHLLSKQKRLLLSATRQGPKQIRCVKASCCDFKNSPKRKKMCKKRQKQTPSKHGRSKMTMKINECLIGEFTGWYLCSISLSCGKMLCMKSLAKKICLWMIWEWTTRKRRRKSFISYTQFDVLSKMEIWGAFLISARDRIPYSARLM